MQIKRCVIVGLALAGAFGLATAALADRGDRGGEDGNGGPGQGSDQRQAPERMGSGGQGRQEPSRPARSAPVQRQDRGSGSQASPGGQRGGTGTGNGRSFNPQGRQDGNPAERRQSYRAGTVRNGYGQGWQKPDAGRVPDRSYGSTQRRQSYRAGAVRNGYGQGWQKPDAGRVPDRSYGSTQRRQSYQAGAVRNGSGQGWRNPNAGRVAPQPYNRVLAHRQLAQLGVHSAPAYIAKPADILRADPAHSTIRFPSHGPGGRAVQATLLTPQGSGNVRVVAQMNLVNSPIWSGRVQSFDRDEGEQGHYYWHHDGDFDFCHYRDDDGFHWYGWYMGDSFFWTRRYRDRWWWYDSDQARWDYYDDGHWWWQDPYHVGLVYCYNAGDYIPDYTAAAQPVPRPQYQGDRVHAVTSPDGSRVVKVMGGTDDAFLYDASADPAFTPRYLASGVKSVEYSDPDSGRPMEIILKLEDGSFDLFDGQGQPYAPQAAGDPNADR